MKFLLISTLILIGASLPEASSAKKTQPKAIQDNEVAEEETTETGPLKTVTCPQVLFLGLPRCWSDCLKQGAFPNCCKYDRSSYTATCECVNVPSVIKPLDYYAFTKKQVGCTVKTFTSSATQFRAEQEEDVEEDEEAEEESAKQKLKTGQ